MYITFKQDDKDEIRPYWLTKNMDKLYKQLIFILWDKNLTISRIYYIHVTLMRYDGTDIACQGCGPCLKTVCI